MKLNTRLVQLLRRLPPGAIVLILAALSTAVFLPLQKISTATANALAGEREPVLRCVLDTREAPPQGFTRAHSVASGSALRDALRARGLDRQAREFLLLDLVFMACYGGLFVAGARWAGMRGRRVGSDGMGGVRAGFGRRLEAVAPLGAMFGAIAVAADFVEFVACWSALNGQVSDLTLQMARGAWTVKWFGTGVAGLVLLGGLVALCVARGGGEQVPARSEVQGVARPENAPEGIGRLSEIWERVARANHFAMKARFSILGGVALCVALLGTAPGKDIVRTLISGGLRMDPATGKLVNLDAVSFESLGWFFVAVSMLSVCCWAWSRLLLGLKFLRPHQGGAQHLERPEFENVEDRLRRDLPTSYGALPLMAAGCAFAVVGAPGRAGDEAPFWAVLGSWSAPLLLLFVVPFIAVLIRADVRPGRRPSRALFWTLMAYVAVAALSAVRNPGEITAWLPLVIFAVGLGAYAGGYPRVAVLLPLGLFVGALLHGAPIPWAPLITLCLLIAAGWKLHRGIVGTRIFRLAGNISPRDLWGVAVGKPLPAHLDPDPEHATERTLRNLLRGLGIASVVHFVFVILIACQCQPVSATLGSGAMVALGLGAWVTWGSLLLVATQAARFPVILSALLAAVAFSAVMDNHGVRLASTSARASGGGVEAVKTAVADRPVAQAFERWLAARHLADSRTRTSAAPCIVVATEGGGIRAAFWTAEVLASLQDASVDWTERDGRPDFASHVFAISGVSGGSVGAAVFAALCADDAAPMRDTAAALLGRDHLAPALGSLLYPDALQRFLPVAIFPDRAEALERSWEAAWRDLRDTDRMAQPFLDLWPGSRKRPWQPALMLNGTLVEDGRRVICSNLPIHTGGGGEFTDTHDLHAHLWTNSSDGQEQWRDLRLSTAALSSARFPVVSPPGRLPSGQRVVDGGYFENSGAATGLEVVNAIRGQRERIAKALHPLSDVAGKTNIIFIFLRYDIAPRLSDVPQPPADPLPRALVPEGSAFRRSPSHLLNESMSIVSTVLNTRTARGSYAQDAIANRYAAELAGDKRLTVLSFDFVDKAGALPLSWSLSRKSCADMLDQFPQHPETMNLSDSPDYDSTLERNARIARELMEALYPK